MRSAPKSEQEKLEIEAAERTDRRKGGFALGKIRDEGHHKFRNLNGGEIHMYWHVDAPLEEGIPRRSVPDNHFILETDKDTLVFEAEEFRRWLRWT